MSSQQLNKFYIPFEYNIPLDNFEPQNWNSLFIPSLPPGLADDEILTYLIQEVFNIGTVKRVDIINKENSDNRLMAFIHFKNWKNLNSTLIFREKIENEGHVDVYGFLNFRNVEMNYKDFIYNIKKDLFLRFLINKTPIKDTELNIHQLADVLEKAECTINEQQLMIEKLTQELESTKIHVENLNLKIIYLENKPNSRDIHYINIDEVDEISDLDEIDFINKKPKMTRELYINTNNKYTVYEDSSLFALQSKFDQTLVSHSSTSEIKSSYV